MQEEFDANKRLTRQAAKLLASSGVMMSSSDNETADEANTTIVETQVNDGGIEEQLQILRAKLEAVTAFAAKEKQERQRLEILLKWHQKQSALPNPVTSDSASANVSASSSVTNTSLLQPMTAATVVCCSGSVTTTVMATIASTTASIATAPIYSSSSSFLGGMSTEQIARPSYAPYSWQISNPSSMQHFPVTTMNLTPYSSNNSDTIPTFLPPLNALQTVENQHYVPQSTFRQAQPIQQPSTSSAGGYGSHRKLHDLPEFHGKAEEWPMFVTAFMESTNMFGYSKVENMFRLQKSVKGEARDVVESLLIHPNNVEQVMASLEFRFGRPECLVQSQLKKVREVAQIPESRLELIIPFATKVQNLTVFLEASGMQQHMANPTLLDELVSKLPMSKRLEWAQCSVYVQPYATIRHFNDWLSRIARLVCVITTSSLPSSTQGKGESNPRAGNVLHTNQSSTTTVSNGTCRHCKGRHHPVAECSSFLKLDTPNKWEFVKRHKLCFGCLKYGHDVRVCRAQKICNINNCARMHHQSLHEAEPTKESTTTNENNERADTDDQNLILNCKDEGVTDTKVLFRVVPVRLYNCSKVVQTYALLDEGSSVTIMSTDLATRLQLSGKSKNLNLRWLGRETLSRRSIVVDIEISADHENAEKFQMVGVQTVKGLCLPTQTFAASEIELKSQAMVPLAGYKEAKPEILIGLDNSHLGAPLESLVSLNDGPIVVRTKLGWVAYGKAASGLESNAQNGIALCSSKFRRSDLRLDRIVDEYFCIENFGVKVPTEKLFTEKDKRAIKLLTETTVKVNDRFQTGLLWKDDEPELPDSYPLARRRLLNLETRMKRDPEFAATYKQIIASYVEKGYAKKLTSAEVELHMPKTWYLPHFGVKNPNKPGKIRLVFDAAAEVSGLSLNSFLLKGPDNNVPLLAVLYNFRIRPVAVIGDIKEMFHQIRIQPDDQHSQRFLWRDNPAKPIDVYVMKVMTFGASCSPCSANFVKNLNASKFVKDYPRAVKAILSHHYVDDYVDSFESVSEATEVTKAVIDIHRSGGFELRNLTSSSKEVSRFVSNVKDEDDPGQTIDMNIEASATTERVLGMCWDAVEDVIVFRLKFPRVNQDIMMNDKCPTKREFLSISMSIFDPFGMIANFALPLKLLLQSIWRFGVQWDEPIPNEVFLRWKQWRAELPSITQVKIPRCHSRYLTRATKVDLHTFVDASEEAFSAVTYLRIEKHDKVFVSFLCGKTRCSPKKLISIPRLELSAAVLGIRLYNSIVHHHDLQLTDSIFWSDSKTVLHWLRSDPRRHKEFVAFRIAEIMSSTQISQWRWVPSKLNPADEGTRAHFPPQFVPNNKWINGPTFLKFAETEWPKVPVDISNHNCKEELRLKYVLNLSLADDSLFEATRFSSFLKLRRTMARVTRFINICQRKPTEAGELSSTELKNAERIICSQVQKERFSDDIANLRQNLPVSKSSEIYKLTPYLDDHGLLRVLGRIDAATTIPLTTRRPIILPKNHAVTKLVVKEFHCRLRHQNDDTIVNEVRQYFWVPSLRSAVKRSKNECQLCRIRRAKPIPPMMGQLPEDRVTPFVRPFTYTGLDYFGPVNITIGRRKEKRWIALFTCLTIRAVHLEIAANLSTDACILCIRNFINRRGIPLRIRSDNGTNFVGASRELASNDIFDNEAIKMELSSAGIEWVFNCPLNPHAGGCWERLVQSIKRVLSYVLHELAPKIETLQSALIEAENIVNSRPLTHLPVSVEDEEPLTPNHFLMGVSNSTQTPGPVEDRALCLRKQWRVSQQLKNRFWKRWMREYLPMLTKRCKWFEQTTPLKVGDLVLVCDVDAPRGQWTRGRITKVFSGPDGQIRSAEIKTNMGALRRPAVKLAVLEVSEASERGSIASRGVGCRKY